MSVVALNACFSVTDPDRALPFVGELLARLTPDATMWGNELLAAPGGP